MAELPSYVSKEQYDYLYESILDLNQTFINQANTVEEIELKLIDVDKKR